MAAVKIRHEVVRDAIRWARRYIPIPVSFRSVDDLGVNVGLTSYSHQTGRYVVSILRSLSETEAMDALLHELGHVMDVHRNGWKDTHLEQHGDTWGKEHSRIYGDYWEWRHANERKGKNVKNR